MSTPCCSKPRACAVVSLIFLLSIGRFITWNYLKEFDQDLKKILHMTEAETEELPEWYVWPNIICDVFCGYLIDHIVGLNVAAVLGSLMTLAGYTVFLVAYYTQSYVGAVMGQLAFGIGCESLFIIQVVFTARYFGHRNLHWILGMLFGLSSVEMSVGEIVMRQGLGHPALALSALIVGPILSFLVAVTLCFVHRDDSVSYHHIEYQKNKRFYFFFVLLMVMTLVIWLVDFRFCFPLLKIINRKYRIFFDRSSNIDVLLYITNPLFAVSYLTMGFVLHWVHKRAMMMHIAFLLLSTCNLILVTTFWNPWAFIIIQLVCTCTLQLSIWILMFRLVPPDEFATGAGFLSGIKNIAIGLTGKLYPQLMTQAGMIVMGLVNAAFLNTGTFLSLIFWTGLPNLVSSFIDKY